jgi:RNA polymerase sigma-54 factor
LNVPVAEVEAACECLKRLNPKPGRLFSGDLPPFIVPDLIITRRERHYDVDLNDQGMPHVGINRSYYRMLKNPNTPEEAKEFLLKKLRQANWIVKAIDERNATLLAIGRCLISLQRDFVEQGPKALKPLTQSQVAELIGRHASTVSRAIAGKSLDTPYGVFRLEQLFASSVSQGSSSADVSDATIKSEIQRLVSEEDALRPLSDEAICQQLAQRHITVARRTIAKYRTSLKILPAHLRKRRGG